MNSAAEMLAAHSMIRPGDTPVERIAEAGGLYFRSVLLREAGMVIPQHTHDHDHATLVCSGSARGWCDGKLMGDKSRGEAFEVLAGHQHIFESLEPMTMLTCVHDIYSTLSIARKGL